MDFEQLITLIFVLAVWGISNVFRKAAKTDPRNRDAANQTPGLLETLQKTLASLQETSGSDREEELELDNFLQTTPEAKPEAQPIASGKAHSKAYRRTESPRQERETAPIPVSSAQSGSITSRIRTRPTLNLCRHNLRDAVIWSEILAPPLALRDSD